MWYSPCLVPRSRSIFRRRQADFRNLRLRSSRTPWRSTRCRLGPELRRHIAKLEVKELFPPPSPLAGPSRQAAPSPLASPLPLAAAPAPQASVLLLPSPQGRRKAVDPQQWYTPEPSGSNHNSFRLHLAFVRSQPLHRSRTQRRSSRDQDGPRRLAYTFPQFSAAAATALTPEPVPQAPLQKPSARSRPTQMGTDMAAGRLHWCTLPKACSRNTAQHLQVGSRNPHRRTSCKPWHSSRGQPHP